MSQWQRCRGRRWVIGLCAVAGTSPLAGQAAGAAAGDRTTEAAAVIRPTALLRRVAALAADSLRDRATPSEALDRASRYVATEFGALGMANRLQIRRYPIPGRTVRLNPSASWLTVGYMAAPGGRTVVNEQGWPARRDERFSFVDDARLAVSQVPDIPSWNDNVKFLSGRPIAASLRDAAGASQAVLYQLPMDVDSAARREILDELYADTRGAIVIAAEDSARFAAEQAKQARAPLQLRDSFIRDGNRDDEALEPWVVEVRAGAITGLLTRLPIDREVVRAAGAPVLRDLPGVSVGIRLVFDSSAAPPPTAPSVVALLPGRDSALAQQCVALVAPLDSRQADASTVSLAGLIELAHAFEALDVAPKRSVLFLAVGGGAAGQRFWGSYEFLRHWGNCRVTFALVVDLGIGGRGLGDTVAFGGLDEVKLAVPPDQMAMLHPELNLVVVDGGTVAEPKSDAYAFGRRGYPSLLAQGGMDTAAGGRPVMGVDADRTTRLLRLVFYVANEAANADIPPQWTAVGRRRVFAR